MSLKYWVIILHKGDFLSRHLIHRLFFRKDIVVMSLWKNWFINPRKIWIQRETFFVTNLLYYILHVFNKKIMLMMTLLKMYVILSCQISESTFGKFFSGVSTILINKKICRRLSWNVDLLLFFHFLLLKLTIILIIWSREWFF